MNYSTEYWLNISSANLVVKDEFQYFHNHAKEILNYNNGILLSFKEALANNISIKTQIRKKGGDSVLGIGASTLNKEIRMILRDKFDSLKFEVNEQNGVYYFSSDKEKQQIAGFDFALLNSKNNLIKLRNLCFGELKYSDGRKRWNRFLSYNPNLKEFSDEILHPERFGENIPQISSDEPLVLGEIQFGNWALVYRDFFKLLKANVQTSVDCLIYVVPAGNLESMLSDGIVTYDKTVKLLKDFSKVINVPVWVLGLDIKV